MDSPEGAWAWAPITEASNEAQKANGTRSICMSLSRGKGSECARRSPKCWNINLMMGDVKQAFRLFAKSLGFTTIVLVTLALGIGANTAVFSVVDGVLLRPLPYKSPDRLIDILDTSLREKELAKIFASYTDFEEF